MCDWSALLQLHNGENAFAQNEIIEDQTKLFSVDIFRAKLLKYLRRARHFFNALHPYTPYLPAALLATHFSLNKKKTAENFFSVAKTFFRFPPFFRFSSSKKTKSCGKFSVQKNKLSVKLEDYIFVLFVQEKNFPPPRGFFCFSFKRRSSEK